MEKFFCISILNFIFISYPLWGNDGVTISGYSDCSIIYLCGSSTDKNALYIFSNQDIDSKDTKMTPAISTRAISWERRSTDIENWNVQISQNNYSGLVFLCNFTLYNPISIIENKVIIVDSDIDGITWRKGAPGINPVDQIAINIHSLKTFEEHKNDLQKITEDERSKLILERFNHRFDRRPKSVYPPLAVLALTGMYNPDIGRGYAIGLSKSEEFDEKNIVPSAILWIGEFSSPEFQVSHLLFDNNDRYLRDRFTHVASSFFNGVPLLAYRNERDQSIRVMDYDPQLMLTGSPSCQVTLPPKFQTHEVESLLLTSGKERAYLGVVFWGKKTEEPKTLFLFYRTKESTDWNEYHQFALPNDSLSPTMCLQGNDLFYAYLQPVIIENPPEIADKNGKTSTEKKLVIFKHSLNPNSIQPNKSAQPEPRKWTSRDGQYSIEARYISATEEYVRLEKLEGKVITVEFSKLSYADQSYVKRQIELEMQTKKNKQEKP